jgi:hypothetical protein
LEEIISGGKFLEEIGSGSQFFACGKEEQRKLYDFGDKKGKHWIFVDQKRKVPKCRVNTK